MKKHSILFIIAIFFCEMLPAQNRIIVDASQAKDTINKNIYGHFAEHLGHCIYGGFFVFVSGLIKMCQSLTKRMRVRLFFKLNQ